MAKYPKKTRPPKDFDGFFFDPEAPRKRPKLAAAAAELIALSSSLDVQIGLLLSRLLGANAGPAIAIYQSLRNSNSRIDAVIAALGEILSDDDKTTLRKLLEVADTAQKPRHRFAHWIWGYQRNDPKVIALMDPSMQLETLAIGVHMKDGETLKEGSLKLRKPAGIIIHTVETIRSDIKRLEAAGAGIALFSHVASNYRLSDDPDGKLVEPARALISKLLATQGSQESQEQARQNKKEARQRQREQALKAKPPKAPPQD